MLLYKTLLLMLHHDLIIIYINYKKQTKQKPINSLDYRYCSRCNSLEIIY